MNTTKISTINLIENSDLGQKDQDEFINLAGWLPDRICQRILVLARQPGPSLERVWQGIKSKYRLLARLEQVDFLEKDKKEKARQAIIDNLSGEKAGQILEKKEIDLEEVKKENERLRKTYEQDKQRIASIKEAAYNDIDNILENFRKKSENAAIEDIRADINSSK